MSLNLPVILGGMPLLDHPLNIVRPVLPPLEAIQERLARALATGQLTNNGQYVRQFEAELASYLGVKHAIALGNATVALMILARALGQEGEIILPSFTYCASAHAVVWAGLKPVFADILPDTYTLDPAAVARLINRRTVAIMGVHIYGHACEVEDLQAVADAHGVPLMFDAAHATGSRYRGRLVGGFGLAEVLSFHATKIFPVGEGGAIVTNDDDLAGRLRLWRTFGDPGTENTRLPGLNGKMQEFNALIGLENLKVIDQHIAHRRAIADLIRAELANVPGIVFQAQRPYVFTNYQNFSVLIEAEQFGLNRDELFLALKAENINTRKYFYPPLHQHDAYLHVVQPAGGDLNITERVAARVLCLPIYSNMTEHEARAMCVAIRRIQQHATQVKAALTQ